MYDNERYIMMEITGRPVALRLGNKGWVEDRFKSITYMAQYLAKTSTPIIVEHDLYYRNNSELRMLNTIEMRVFYQELKNHNSGF